MNQFPVGKSLTSAVVVVGVAWMALGSWYTIDGKERGVVLRNGRVVEAAEPGLHFKLPLVDRIEKISTQHNTLEFPRIEAYSQDQQPASLRVSVSYHIPPDQVVNVYTSYANVEGLETRLIARQVPTQIENVFGQYNAVSAVQHRVKLVADVTKALRENVLGPVEIDSVQVENIDFSDAYEKAISDRMNAEVAVATRNQELEKERVNAKITVTAAQAAADAALAKATAEAQATRRIGSSNALFGQSAG